MTASGHRRVAAVGAFLSRLARAVLLGVLLLVFAWPVDRPPGERFRPWILARLGRPWQVYNQAHYAEARRLFLGLAREFRAQNEPGAAAFASEFAAQCAAAALDYSTAMRELLEAEKEATRLGSWKRSASVLAAMSSIYAQMGDLDDATAAAEKSLRLIPDNADSSAVLPALVHAVTVIGWRSDTARSRALYARAIFGADLAGDLMQEANVWHYWGEQLLNHGRYDEAEAALLRAFRIRRLARNPSAADSLFTLGRLEHLRGNLKQASVLYDASLEQMRRDGSSAPAWIPYYRRGCLRRDMGRPRDALEDFRTAFTSARAWRIGALPSDATRVGTEVRLDQVASALVQTATELSETGHDPGLARLAFEVADENRASSLRQAALESRASQLGRTPEYAETLEQLRRAESDWLRNPDGTSKDKVLALTARLDHFDVSLGLGLLPRQNLAENIRQRTALTSFQRALRSSEAMLVFERAGDDLLLWTVTKGSFCARRLPIRASSLAKGARRFRDTIASGSEESVRFGRSLYVDLLGTVDAIARSKPAWLLVLDDALFNLPFAALVPAIENHRPRYLVENHSLQIIPGAWVVLGAGEPAREGSQFWSGRFVGFGDPVYNEADTRRQPGPSQAAGRLPGRAPPMQLTRLPGSSREVASCARAWGGPAEVYTGNDVSRARLESALGANPSVLHFAAHVVEGPDRKRGPYLALSLDERGEPAFVGSREVAAWRSRIAMVVLNGCDSGSGEVLPGAGLVGLTRSWILAGARMVAATYWPTADDDGLFFSMFYRKLRARADLGPAAAADALCLTQREMIASGTWRSQPRYWAAYFLMGRR